MAKTTRLGYEGQIKIGPAGSTGTTQLTNRTDIQEDYNPEWADTSVAGAGTAVPHKDEEIVQLAVSITFSLVYDSTDAAITTLLGYIYGGTPFALRTLAFSTGKGFDGDVTAGIKHGKKMKEGQTFEIECHTNERARAWQVNV